MTGSAPSPPKPAPWANVTFDEKEAYNWLGRPRGYVALVNQAGGQGDWRTFAAVDTGADRLQLPDAAARYVGLSLAGAQRVRVWTAGANAIVMHALDVDVLIQGVQVRATANFAPDVKPLLGRNALLSAMKTAGFNQSDWLIEWHRRPGAPAGQVRPLSASQPVPRQPSETQDAVDQIEIDGPWLRIGGVRVPRHVLNPDERRELWRQVQRQCGSDLDPEAVQTVIRDYVVARGRNPDAILLGDVLF